MFWFQKSLPSSLYSQTRLQQAPHIAVKASDYQIIENTSIYYERLLELIRNAKERIMMTMLYLQDDGAGNEVLTALYEAKKRNPNLYIRVYVDFHRAQRGLIGKEASSTNRDMYERFAKDISNPPAIYGVPVKRRELFGVMHLKGFVFDNTVLYSGASINDVYCKYQNKKYRLDRYHEINSKELADTFCRFTTEVFHQNFAVQDFSQGHIKSARDIKNEIKAFQRILQSSQYNFKNARIREDEVGITPIAGMGKHNNQLNRSIIWALSSARYNLFIFTPYFNPPREVIEEIEKALEREVQVTIVVGDKIANDFFIHDEQDTSAIGAIPYIYEQNLRNFVHRLQRYIDVGLLNIQLWKDGINTYHLKGIYVDRHLAIITGSNLNPRAWSLDLENGMIVHDPNHLLQEKFMHEKLTILQNCHKINSQEDLEGITDYPEHVKKLLKKVNRFGAIVFLKKFL